ncbi:MAG: TRAP transporter large permease subunit [Longimicrobiales bacterium]|nr:TRAP transporter large permease subunit [Longimicrobiales bacterium]
MTSQEGNPVDERSDSPRGGWAAGVTGTIAAASLGAMVLLPLLDLVFRQSGVRISTDAWVRHLTLWVGLFGAFLASARERHLSIAVGEAVRSSAWKNRFDILSRGGTLGILLCLAFASGKYVIEMRGYGAEIGGWLPFWVAVSPMPVAFSAMAIATLFHTGKGWLPRLLVPLLAILIGPILVVLPLGDGSLIRILGIGVLCILAAVGMPLFAALGGASLLLFFLSEVPVTSIPDAIYEIASEAYLPSIPLFALVGVVLARGGGPQRLIRLAQAWTGWLPGGASLATIVACAFFTAITGASGVTILALGGLLFPVLLAARHSEKFGLGLLTASGSVGLLFPPSIPVILYAVRGQISFVKLFLAGLLPGILLLSLLAGFCMFQVRDQWADRPRFDLREAVAATRIAWGDILLPVLVVWAFFGGYLTIVGAAALAALWALILEVGVHRTLGLRKGLPSAFVETCFLVGALVAVIALAFGLFGYLVWAQIPDQVVAWVMSVIQSKWAFLLVLNLLLLLVGAMMDIFSAIILVVPLIVPLAAHYEIGLAHIGVVFLANLELGYLTPPVGMNLFLSALTFDRPLLKIWRASFPFLAIVAAWVLVVTYVPWLSEGFANLIMGR